MIKDFYFKILNLGVDDSTDSTQILAVRTTNFFTIFSFFSMLVTVLFFSFESNYTPIVINIISFCGFLPIPYLNSKFKNHISKIYLIVLLNGDITLFASLTGEDMAIHLFLLINLVLPFLLYRISEKKSLIFALGVPIACLIFLYSTNFAGPFDIEVDHKDWGLGKSVLMVVLYLIGLLYLLARAFENGVEYIKADRDKAVQSAHLTTLGMVAASITHELNNPLSIVMLYLEVLIEKLDHPKPGKLPLTSAEISRDLAKSLNAAQRMKKIIGGFKAISRNSINDDKQYVSVQKIIEEIVVLTADKVRKAEVIIKIEPILDEFIACREGQIGQVLINLINNACDAIECLEEKWIRISTDKTKEEFAIIVTDSGKGIPPEVLKKLMTPFFTTKSIGKGTGLGLSISKQIMNQHDGDLFYDNTSANTSFKIVFTANDLMVRNTEVS